MKSKLVPLGNGWMCGQYRLFRLLFGLYLLVHFAHLVPWGPELFSSAGMMPDAATSPLAYVIPNVLVFFDEPAFVVGLLVVACLLSILFAIGWRDRWVAVALWYLWACLHARNPFIGNPSMPYVGWLLLAHAALPRTPAGILDRLRTAESGEDGWRMPPEILAAAWILMVVGYSYSGWTKLTSPSWLDGSALAHVLENPLARPTALRTALLDLPSGVLRAVTWGGLALEIGAAPLALGRRLRPWLWSALLAMHVALLVLIDFADLSLGMIMLHLFTFDPAWLPVRARRGRRRRQSALLPQGGKRALGAPAADGQSVAALQAEESPCSKSSWKTTPAVSPKSPSCSFSNRGPRELHPMRSLISLTARR